MAKTLQNPVYRAMVDRLISIRKSIDLNQRDLAERLGQPQSYVAKVELCERRLDVVQLVEWLRALDVEESKFLKEVVAAIPKKTRKRSAL